MICCIITWAAAELYQRYQREQKEIRRINEQNKNKTVEEILKTKKGSIKRAPLPPNGPNWDVILNMTLAEYKPWKKRNLQSGMKYISYSRMAALTDNYE